MYQIFLGAGAVLLTSLLSVLGKLFLLKVNWAVDKQVWNETGHVTSLPFGIDRPPDLTA